MPIPLILFRLRPLSVRGTDHRSSVPDRRRFPPSLGPDFGIVQHRPSAMTSRTWSAIRNTGSGGGTVPARKQRAKFITAPDTRYGLVIRLDAHFRPSKVLDGFVVEHFRLGSPTFRHHRGLDHLINNYRKDLAHRSGNDTVTVSGSTLTFAQKKIGPRLPFLKVNTVIITPSRVEVLNLTEYWSLPTIFLLWSNIKWTSWSRCTYGELFVS